jgi:glycosyltransferase involved in cell wall biosynthesis
LIKRSEVDRRLRYFFNESSLGACASRNIAIYSARGEFITGLDDDDFFHKNRISAFVDFWPNKSQKSVGLFADSDVLLCNGKVITTNRPKSVFKKDIIDSNFVGNQIFTKTTFFKKSGGFDESFPAWQDLECWYRMLSDEYVFLQNVCSVTYLTDMSHSHERISSNSIDKIKKSKSLFSEKFNLSGLEKNVLNLQMLTYGPIDFSLKLVLMKAIRNPTYAVLRQSARFVLIKIRCFINRCFK